MKFPNRILSDFNISDYVYVLIRQTDDYPWRAVVKGFESLTFPVKTAYQGERLTPYSIVVTWNNYGFTKTIADQCKAAGGIHIIMENGFVRGQKERYYSAAKGCHLTLNKKPRDAVRWGLLDVNIQPWKTHGDHVLVCAQRGGHLIKSAMPKAWPVDVLKRLRSITNRPIHYRPHPGKEYYPENEYLNGITCVSPQEPLASQLANAHAVVVYSSNCATDALLHGVPVFYEGQALICKELSTSGITEIETPFYPEREETFKRLAYAQWSESELEKGEPWEYVLGLT